MYQVIKRDGKTAEFNITKIAEAIKKAFDMIMQGEPLAVYDKNADPDSNGLFETFAQNLQQNFIAPDILEAMRRVENEFCTRIGINNTNTDKKSRMLVDEVNANNGDTSSKVSLWLETMQEGIKQCNDLFGTNISVSLRYGGEGNGAVLNNDALQLRSDDI